MEQTKKLPVGSMMNKKRNYDLIEESNEDLLSSATATKITEKFHWVPMNWMGLWRDKNGRDRLHLAILLPTGINYATKVEVFDNGCKLLVKAKWPQMFCDTKMMHNSRSFDDTSKWNGDELDSMTSMVMVKDSFHNQLVRLVGDSTKIHQSIWSTAMFDLPIRVRDHPDRIRRFGSGKDGCQVIYIQLSGYEEKTRKMRQDVEFVWD